IGQSLPMSEKWAESQAESARVDWLAAQQFLDAKEGALQNLIMDNLATSPELMLEPVELPDFEWLPPSRNLSLMEAMINRPDLLWAQFEVEKQGVMVRYHRNQMFPSLDL